MSNFDLSVRFFLQLAFILGVCRAVGLLAQRAGQSQVVSEMIAGVLMGPSLLGILLPGVHGYMFPRESMPIIFSMSQVGLSLYMFLVGLEFNVELIVARARSAVAVSLAGIIVPFSLGAGLALALFGRPELFSSRTTPLEAVLFTGASMSITAFPMLARIIFERGLSGTSLGTLALAAGSLDDAAAWCILAVVLASFSGNAAFAVTAIGGGVVYAGAVLIAGRPLLRRLGTIVEHEGRMSSGMLTFVLMLVMLGSWFTDSIRIYAVFGAFIMGVAMPRGRFAAELEQRLEPLVTTFLLPLFFVYSGLNTRIGLLNSLAMWVLTLGVLVLATAGKGVACFAAARLSGEPRREALAIGTLMNSRGLMELIILNIGLERGVIEPALFTIMVMMAIVTTLMATPVFEWVYRRGETVMADAA
ncbi:MAG TPA: cation:proton antiporter [Candidatus Bathyarchaeia archaeon]|nr:cation:proton antiporter [Candidatus Bathyarchaeia archaeon]